MPTNKPLSERLMDCADARLAQARVARSDVAALKFAARALDLIELAVIEAQIEGLSEDVLFPPECTFEQTLEVEPFYDPSAVPRRTDKEYGFTDV